MKVKVLDNPQSPQLIQFFKDCESQGFNNNTSLEKIKYSWAVNERKGRFWSLSNNDQIIAMAGCHWMPEINPQAFRIQFRGCELPGKDEKKTLSRSQFNSMTFRELIPLQIEYINQLGDFELFISTNHDNRNHRAMELIAKQGFLEKHIVGEFFYTQQTIWKFNTEHYLRVRSKIKSYID